MILFYSRLLSAYKPQVLIEWLLSNRLATEVGHEKRLYLYS